MDTILHQGIVLFRFIGDKDIFEQHYKRQLANRLLNGKNASDDLEKNLINRLRTECGFQFTTKMEGMFNDLRTSLEISQSFKNSKVF